MNIEDKILTIGMVCLVFALMLTAALQVGYRAQAKARENVREQIVLTQQNIAAANMTYSSLTRSEVIRSVVLSVYPKSVPIGFNKTININEIPNR